MRLRDITPRDKPALARFHRRLSDDTRYRRYHAAKGDLTSSDLKYLTELDPAQHVAVVAEEPRTDDLAGVARVVADPAHPGEAEVAIVIRDDVHGHGLGRDLVQAVLNRAAGVGASTVVAQVQADNHRALRLFQGFGFRQRAWNGAVVELVCELDTHGS